MSRTFSTRLAALGLSLAAVVVAASSWSANDPVELSPSTTALAAVVGRPIPASTIGMHPAVLTGTLTSAQLLGVTPSTGLGAVTIVGNGSYWREVQPRSAADADFTALDSAIDNARSQGVRQINLVLGGTPCWAASKATSSTEVPRCFASPPKSYVEWRRYVALVLSHVATRITSIQIWAEADLPTRWAGTPTQMAIMTKLAYDVTKWPSIQALNPNIVVASASTTTRLKLATGEYLYRFWYPYLKALGAYKWPIHVFVGNFYPPSNGTPVTRQQQIARFKAVLAKAYAPRRAIWEGEVNYGGIGPGTLPYRNLNNLTGAAYVARTYLDDLRIGISRSYWSAWMPYSRSYGITMWPGTYGAKAQATTFGWLAGKWFRGCASSKLTTGVFVTCLVSVTTDSASATARILYSEGSTRLVTVPRGVSRLCYANGSCAAVKVGQVIKVGQLPAWLGR